MRDRRIGTSRDLLERLDVASALALSQVCRWVSILVTARIRHILQNQLVSWAPYLRQNRLITYEVADQVPQAADMVQHMIDDVPDGEDELGE